MNKIIVMMCLFCCVAIVQAQETIKIYVRNFHNPFVIETLENITALSTDKFGDYEIVSSRDMEQGRAFAELSLGNIDVIVTSPTLAREARATMIPIPIDRGLLGIRICMINSPSNVFAKVRSADDFRQEGFTIGSAAPWPDTKILIQNKFDVVSAPFRQSLFKMLSRKRFSCLTRSILEIDYELKNEPMAVDFKEDPHLLFMYPNSDFVFVNPHKPQLVERLRYGLERAIENKSYYQIFDKYYSHILRQHKAFERTPIRLRNVNISEQAKEAINRFGVVSFLNDTKAH